MKYKKEISLVISSLAFILLMVFLSLLLGDRFNVHKCGCPNVISHNFVFLFIFLSIVFIGGLVYFLLSLKIESQEKIMNKNIDLLYRCLDENENSVIREIIKNKGEIMQKELNEKFGKVKVHRGLKKLEDKKMIIIKKQKKGNYIKLNNELKKELIK